VHLFTDVGNTASQAVAVRAGFTREGVVRACLDQRDGGRADAVLFGRVAGD
jgi:RimJ/RimL family protein N-acetyltransferase